MGPRVLVLSLVTPAVLGQTLRHIREWLPEATITVLVGADDVAAEGPFHQTSEILDWRSFGSRELVAELRGRRFDLIVVAHGSDHYLSRAYWKAVVLALASGARAKLFCEEGVPSPLAARPCDLSDLPAGARSTIGVLVGAAAGAALRIAQEAFVASIGLLLLAAVVVGIMVTDITEALGGGLSAGGGRGRWKDRG